MNVLHSPIYLPKDVFILSSSKSQSVEGNQNKKWPSWYNSTVFRQHNSADNRGRVKGPEVAELSKSSFSTIAANVSSDVVSEKQIKLFTNLLTVLNMNIQIFFGTFQCWIKMICFVIYNRKVVVSWKINSKHNHTMGYLNGNHISPLRSFWVFCGPVLNDPRPMATYSQQLIVALLRFITVDLMCHKKLQCFPVLKMLIHYDPCVMIIVVKHYEYLRLLITTAV